MFNKGDRVLYRNTHFGTVQASELDPPTGVLYVRFDKPYVGGGKVVPVRVEDVIAVTDAAHEQELSLKINKIAPSREEWKSKAVRLSDIDIQRGTKEGDITLKIYDRDDNMVATITDTPSKLQEFALRILQQTTYRLADHEKN